MRWRASAVQFGEGAFHWGHGLLLSLLSLRVSSSSLSLAAAQPSPSQCRQTVSCPLQRASWEEVWGAARRLLLGTRLRSGF